MQFLRFLAVGMLNSAVGLALIYVAMALGCAYRSANAIGYAGGIVLSFVLNRNWTFADAGDWHKSILAWLAVVGAAYAVQLAFVIGVHDGAGIDARVAQALGVPVYTLLTFLSARRFAFRNRAAS